MVTHQVDAYPPIKKMQKARLILFLKINLEKNSDFSI